MRIGVFVSSWEQGCCGTAAGIGDEVTWELTWGREWIEASYGPEEAAGVDFAETHHGGDDAPRVAVAGRILSVDAVLQRFHRPDPGGPWTNVVGESTSVAVERLPGHGEDEDEAGAAVAVSVALSDENDVSRPFGPGFILRSAGPDALDLAGQSGVAGWRVRLDVDDGTALPDAR